MQPRILSLFSGYGGLDMAVQEVFGGELVAFADIDSGPCKILAHRHPDVPNLGDVSTVDWTTIHADIICGGSPCQDLSTAGRRAGMTDGTRSNLWAMMREAIAHIRPQHVVWENVRGAYSARADSAMESDPRLLGDHPAGVPALRALGRVLGDLADLGYDAQWCGLPASGVGAPHGRFRVFLLATDATGERGGEGDDAARLGARRPGASAVLGERDWRAAANADQPRLEGQQDQAGAAQAGRHGHALAGAGGPDLTLLPTPTATPYGSNQSMSPGAAVRPSLDGIIQLLTTPRSSDTNGAGAHGQGGLDLRSAIDLLPTPRATDGTKGGPNQRGSSGDLMLPSAVTHLLQTPFVADATGGHERRGGKRGGELLLAGQVKEIANLLPTPRATNMENRQSERFRGADGNFYGLLNGLTDWGKYAASIARWEAIHGPAPAPTMTSPRSGNQQLSPAFAEWMMGLPAGWITDVPGVTRNEALKACGNGVVPQQAIAALRHMLAHQAVAA